MSMSVSLRRLRARVRRRPRRRGPLRPAALARPRPLPADAHRGSALSPGGPRGCSPPSEQQAAGGRPDAHRLPGGRPLLALLRPALHHAAGRRRVVVRARRRPAATRRATCSRSWQNHGTLSVSGSPTWRTVVGGSRTYVDKLAKELSAVLTATPVRALRRLPAGGVAAHRRLRHRAALRRGRRRHPSRSGARACSPTRPPPSARSSALSGTPRTTRCCTPTRAFCPTAKRSDGLVELPHVRPAMTTAENVAGQLRHDPAAAAADRRRATSSRSAAVDRVDPRTVVDEMVYEHPMYNPESLAAQRRLPELTTAELRARRRLARLGFPRGRRPLRPGAAQALGGSW